MNDWHRIKAALDGDHGDDQQRIAAFGVEWLATLLKKNADYGSAVWQSPPLVPAMPPASAILVRMSDKVQRIATLSQKDAEVDESLADSIGDLGAYCLLWLARPKDEGTP